MDCFWLRIKCRGCIEYDFYRRRTIDGFEIEAVIGGAEIERFFAESKALPRTWGWKDKTVVPLPDVDEAEPVLLCRVRGTADLEVLHELPLEGADGASFTVGQRRQILLAQLVGDADPSREFRVTPGTLASRHLTTEGFRSSISAALAGASSSLELPSALEESLTSLGQLLSEKGLPNDLHLGLLPQRPGGLPSLVSVFVGDNPAERALCDNVRETGRSIEINVEGGGVMSHDPLSQRNAGRRILGNGRSA